MGNFNLTGMLVAVGLFFVLVGFILAQIQVENPYTGMESTVFGVMLDWISPF